MHRRALLASVPVGLLTVSGCLGRESETGTTGETDGENVDSGSDAPAFEVDEDAPGTVMLLRHQPQEPGGVVVGTEFDSAVALGNAGGDPITGEITVELVPPVDDEATQPATVVVDDALPSGGARFFTAGPFTATVTGDWELEPESGVDRIHPAYDGTVVVEDRPDD